MREISAEDIITTYCIFGCPYVLLIALLSAMANQKLREGMLEKYRDLQGSQTTTDTIMREWEKAPYVDVVVVQEDQKCPEDYPEDVIFDTWLGTRTCCDCLERMSKSTVTLD